MTSTLSLILSGSRDPNQGGQALEEGPPKVDALPEGGGDHKDGLSRAVVDSAGLKSLRQYDCGGTTERRGVAPGPPGLAGVAVVEPHRRLWHTVG